jgi:hypothetical protein
MATIIPFLSNIGADREAGVFDQRDIDIMSKALDAVCSELILPGGDHPARRVIAERIIELARHGERNSTALRDRVLQEAHIGERIA